jgi:hypothetical protein
MIFSTLYVFVLTGVFTAAYTKYMNIKMQINTIESEIASVNNHMDENLGNIAVVTNENLATTHTVTANPNFYILLGLVVVLFGVGYLLYSPESWERFTSFCSKTICETNERIVEQFFRQNELNTNLIVSYLDRNVESQAQLLAKLDHLALRLLNLESQLRLLNQPDLPIEEVLGILSGGIM